MIRLFALIRTVFFAAIFVSFWMWLIPRWTIGALQIVHPQAWTVIALGGAICGWCFLEFALRGLGTPAPFDAPRRLVVSGVYRFVRNPMYVGMSVLLLGEAWLTGRAGLVVETLVLIAFTSLLVMAYEEPVLRTKFGEDYAEYCRNVRRWIPRLTPWYSRPHLE